MRHSDNGGHYEVLNEDDECWAHIGLHDGHKVNLEYLEGRQNITGHYDNSTHTLMWNDGGTYIKGDGFFSHICEKWPTFRKTSF